MLNISRFIALVTFFHLAPVVHGKEPNALEILQSSDRARGSDAVSEGISWGVEVHAKDVDKESNISYDLKVKGDDAFAEGVAPARHKGETLLFNDRNIWFFKPGLKKPIAISPRQKLMGQASNGDIASTNYARDYDAKIDGSEKIGGQDTWRLELKAKAKTVTYDRIRYWVSKKDRLGIKAEFLTVNGDVFKRATFEYKNKLQESGKSYPFVSKMVISDAVKKSSMTTLSYKLPRREKHPDSLFNVNNLIR